jgi:dihydrofolate synthase / folylpolyglutamate synthase
MISSPYQRLESLERIGVKLGLRNIKTVLQALGNPHQVYPSILIAGTNAKGSVATMMESILRHHGYRTGSYTSPHLVNLRERIRFNGEMISAADFEANLTSVLETIDELTAAAKLENTPTYFETLTATAFLSFQAAKVDVAIVEVGLGGRFDATNVLDQKLSIITSIDYDHEEFLGKSLAQIASEKAGIMKRNSPAVTGILPPQAIQVILETAEQKETRIFSSDPSDVLSLKLEDGFPIFDYQPWQHTVRVSLRGRHQAGNAAIALLASDVLQECGFDMKREVSAEALNDVRWPGRLDLFSGTPPLLLDCAHNPMGVQSLAQFLEDMNWDRVVCLFTAMRDKKLTSMMRAISGKISKAIITRIEPWNRCATYEQLTQACVSSNVPFEFIIPIRTAFDRAKEEARTSDYPLLIFGSIYLIGEVYRILDRSSS